MLRDRATAHASSSSVYFLRGRIQLKITAAYDTDRKDSSSRLSAASDKEADLHATLCRQ
jgi:hypothetical protein